MKRTTTWYAWVGLVIFALALAAALAPAAPAQAAHASHSTRSRAATSDSLSLSLTNGPTLPYSSSSVFHFIATATLATPLQPGVASLDLFGYIQENGQANPYAVSPATSAGSDNVTFTMPIDLSLAGGVVSPGTHVVYAYFINPDTKNKVTSNTVSFTVSPISAQLVCGAGTSSLDINFLGAWKPGQSVSIAMQTQDEDPYFSIDWTKGAVTITLKGPKTVTYSNLPLNSSGATTITAPTTLGNYAMDCIVKGVPYYSFSDTGFSSPAYLVSQMKLLGGIKLFTNPTTLVQNRSIQMYIVFEPGPGLPTPTGVFSVQVGTGNWAYYTRPQKIAPDGTGSLTLAPIQNLYAANSITITYFGDLNYKQQYKTFPMTNPAISGGGGTTPGQPTATPKPHVTATAGATPTAGAGSGATSGPPAQAPTPTPGAGSSVLGAFGPFSGGGLIALLVIVALLALGGGVGTFVVLSRRGSAPAPHNPSDYPAQWPARSPLDVDTSPRLDTTRPEAPPWWRQDGGPYGGQQ